MDTKTILQEAKTHLISGKPLVVRIFSQKTYPVRAIRAEGIDLVDVIYENAFGCYSMTLYPGSRRFQELEEQFSSPAPEKLFQYDDEREKMEVALIKFFSHYRSVFQDIIVIRVNTPYMKCVDGTWIAGTFVWERVADKPYSQVVYVPARNALDVASDLAIAVKHTGYWSSHSKSSSSDDVRDGLIDCPRGLVPLIDFEPQPPGRMWIDDAMARYPRGTRIRLMECRCEYFLDHKDSRGATWVQVAIRCEEHQGTESVYGWLPNDQVEIVSH